MAKKRYSEPEILKILRENENGATIKFLINKYDISQATFYNWRIKYSGTENNSLLMDLQELQEENEKLKKMYAELSLENHNLKQKLEKKEIKKYF